MTIVISSLLQQNCVCSNRVLLDEQKGEVGTMNLKMCLQHNLNLFQVSKIFETRRERQMLFDDFGKEGNRNLPIRKSVFPYSCS